MNLETYNILEILKENDVFITGGGGVGKSWVTKTIIEDYRLKNKNIVVLASTGIAAINISGQTVHSFFRLGISNNIETLMLNDTNFKVNTKKLSQDLSLVDLIVIDEISLISKNVMDMIDYRLKNSNFNGKFLIVGDFCQIPPVTKEPLVDNIFAFESNLWKRLDMKIVYLEEIKRNTDIEFSEILQRIRINNVNDTDIEFLEKLTKNILPEENSTTLVATNSKANIINKRELEKIDSPLKQFKMETIVYDTHKEKQLKNFCESVPANEILSIKKGAKILFIKNTKSFYNGERGTIVDIIRINNYSNGETIYDYKLIVQKEIDGKYVDVYPEKWKMTKFQSFYNEFTGKDEMIEIPVFEALQFPVKLCYAITIHKSQGMSIDNLICDMRGLFAESQFYVSISRSVNPKNLQLIFDESTDIKYQMKKLLNLNPLVKKFYNLDVNNKKIPIKVLQKESEWFVKEAVF